MRYACIGTGWISRLKHLKHYCGYEDIEPVAVVDTNLQAARETALAFGIPHWYADFEECLEIQRPDIVSICVPNVLHYPMVTRCLEQGIHVHCEKPLTTAVEDALQLVKLSRTSRGTLFVGMNKRYASFSQELKRQMGNPSFGQLISIDMKWIRRRGIPGKGGWFTNKALSGGGALIDLGVHLIDLALYLSPHTEVTGILGATGSNFFLEDSQKSLWAPVEGPSTLSLDVEDSATLLFVLEHRIPVTIQVAWASNSLQDESIEISCSGSGAGLYYSEEKGLRLSRSEESRPSVIQLQEPCSPSEEFDLQCAREIADARTCFLTGSSTSDAVQALEVQKIIESVYSMSMFTAEQGEKRQ